MEITNENGLQQGHQDMHNPTDLNPGGSDTPQKDSGAVEHGQEKTLMGLHPRDPNNRPAPNPPKSGDVDKAATDSATETGQDGDLEDTKKKKAYNYS